MYSLLRNTPRASPAIKQAIAQTHAYPFPLSPVGEWSTISRLNSPLPSPLISQTKFSFILTPPANVGGPLSNIVEYPFPKVDEKKKYTRFQSIPQTVNDLPNHSSARNIKALESKMEKPCLSARRHTNLKVELPKIRTDLAEEITQSINNMTTTDHSECSSIDIADAELDSDVETESFKSIQGRLSTPFYLHGAQWKSYCKEIDSIDISPNKGDWLDCAIDPHRYESENL